MIAFLLSALLTGFVIVFIVPLIKTQLETIPAVAGLVSNRFVQLIFVGAIALAGLGFFSLVAKQFKVR